MNNQPDDTWKYWAFLSYNHRDKRIADWLHKSIESYRIPKSLVESAQSPRHCSSTIVPGLS